MGDLRPPCRLVFASDDVIPAPSAAAPTDLFFRFFFALVRTPISMQRCLAANDLHPLAVPSRRTGGIAWLFRFAEERKGKERRMHKSLRMLSIPSMADERGDSVAIRIVLRPVDL